MYSGLFNLTHKTRARARSLYGEGRYQSDEKLLKTIMKHEVRCSVKCAMQMFPSPEP
jgi:hypothetical protein